MYSVVMMLEWLMALNKDLEFTRRDKNSLACLYVYFPVALLA